MDDEPAYMFQSLDDLLNFVKWLTDNFDTPEDFEKALASMTADEDMDLEDVLEVLLDMHECTRSHPSAQKYLECDDCGAIFVTPSGLNIHRTVLHSGNGNKENDTEFWDIIQNSYVGDNEGTDDGLRNTD
jgi:hypothetical protein